MTRAHTTSQPHKDDAASFDAGYILAIDPSIVSLGYAMYHINRGAIMVGSITMRRVSGPYQVRAYTMASLLAGLFDYHLRHNWVDTVIECPANWQTARGRSSKGAGSIQKLYYLVGLIVGTIAAIPHGGYIYTVYPMEWKGQTPKHIMVRRAHRQADLDSDTPHDACEALMLAKHAISCRVGITGTSLPYIRVDCCTGPADANSHLKLD